MVCVVEMLTTEGISFSAKSANDGGADLEFDSKLKTNKKKNILIKNFLLINF
tara:strand:- start:511 stop:666 length:156 start_codon:yes stop_codon:yes gene_type:complete